MNSDQTRLIAVFLRNLREGRPSSSEEWDAMWKFLEDGSVIALRTDWRYRTQEFFPELERWLRGNEDFLQYTDEQLVNATGSHYYWWLKAQPYPPPICLEAMLPYGAGGEQKRIDEMEDETQETPEQTLIIKQETKPKRGRGRPRKTTT